MCKKVIHSKPGEVAKEERLFSRDLDRIKYLSREKDQSPVHRLDSCVYTGGPDWDKMDYGRGNITQICCVKLHQPTKVNYDIIERRRGKNVVRRSPYEEFLEGRNHPPTTRIFIKRVPKFSPPHFAATLPQEGEHYFYYVRLFQSTSQEVSKRLA